MNIDEIAKTITSKPSNKLVLVGIEGYGGSGKTTLAKQLAAELDSAYIVNIDDFIVKEKSTEASWDKGGFDRKRLEQQVLIPATTGQQINYQKLVWETNTLSKPKHVPAVNYLIIERISCYHPNIAHYYDYKNWVDTPIEIAKARGQARDIGNENESMWDMWAANDLAYQLQYHPEQVADYVIDNQRPNSVDTGTWGKRISWKLYPTDQLPPIELITAAFCVAITDKQKILLARSERGWGLIGGHIEDGETVEQALVREALEEGGFTPSTPVLFAVREVTASQPVQHQDPTKQYPFPISYLVYYYSTTIQPIAEPTGSEILESASFSLNDIEALNTPDLSVIKLGYNAYSNLTK